MADQPPGLKSPGRSFVVKIGEAVAPMMREHDTNIFHVIADAAKAVETVSEDVASVFTAPQGAETTDDAPVQDRPHAVYPEGNDQKDETRPEAKFQTELPPVERSHAVYPD